MEQNTQINNTHPGNIPTHVAVIMDGNGRWAMGRGLEVGDGHRAGVESLRRTVVAALDAGVRYLTVYAFSTENWGRSSGEVGDLMGLFSAIVLAEAEALASRGVRLRFVGDLAGLPADLQFQIEEVGGLEITGERMILTVAMNYSARWDISNAARLACEAGGFDDLGSHLSTHFLPDVDLVIRSSGECRLSNFMLWESAYAELYFTECLWPDFGESDFSAALLWYSSRSRRFGGRVAVADEVE